eukprot:c35888_g1_i1 orf=37-216(-)
MAVFFCPHGLYYHAILSSLKENAFHAIPRVSSEHTLSESLFLVLESLFHKLHDNRENLI